jgi:hypothetical protein
LVTDQSDIISGENEGVGLSSDDSRVNEDSSGGDGVDEDCSNGGVVNEDGSDYGDVWKRRAVILEQVKARLIATAVCKRVVNCCKSLLM